MRVSVLVTADTYSDKLNDVIVITNTNGDLMKNNNVKLIYDAVIMRENPMYHYSYGTMEKTNCFIL